MGYSLIKGRFHYHDGDYFDFNGFVDDQDGGGTFIQGEYIYPSDDRVYLSYLTHPESYIELIETENFTGVPTDHPEYPADSYFITATLHTTSYYDNDTDTFYTPVNEDIEYGSWSNDPGFSNDLAGLNGEIFSGGVVYEFRPHISLDIPTANTPSDVNKDGFVDEITNYQMWAIGGGIDLTNRRGKTYSDDTSKMWNAVKAIEEDDGGFSVLVEGQLKKEGKYKVASANSEGVVGGITRWLNGDQMAGEGYEYLFGMDFNGNNQIDYS